MAQTTQNVVELLITFPLAHKWFALPAQNVMAIMQADQLEPLVKNNTTDLMGCVKVRSSKVLVRDLTALLVPGALAGPAEQIILFRALTAWAGMTTAGTAEMIPVPASQLALNNTVGTYQIDQRTITLLDPELLLSSVHSVWQN